MFLKGSFAATAVLATATLTSAIKLDIHDEQSIKNAAAIAAFNTMSNYTSNHTGQAPGYLSGGKWWQGGSLFDIMIQYWHYTGDSSNNAAVSQGMYWQRGENDDYMPANYSMYLGNDDQATWGHAAMTAAELDFPQDSSMPSWIGLAENVWHTQVQRWDTQSCDGGLRGGIWPYQNTWTVKWALGNGLLFQLSARLARYTGNQTYADWAEKIWDWSTDTLLNTKDWKLADSTDANHDCKSQGNEVWTHNYGAYISGAAYMYNVTNGKETKWQSGLDGLLNSTFHTFFPEKFGGKIMSEVMCEPLATCSSDQDIFKGHLASDLTFTTLVAPYTASDIMPRLKASAAGAAKQCTGGSNNTLCGRRWYQSKWDGTANMAEQMSATSIFTSNLVAFKDKAPATDDTAFNATVSSKTGRSSTASENPETTTDVVNGGNALVRPSLEGTIGLVAGIVAVAQAFR